MIIDIREKEEINQEKIKGAINLPLSEKENLENFIEHTNTDVIVMCRSGKRAEMFYNSLCDKNKKKCVVYEGGVIAYSKKNETLKTNNVSLPIFRQVLIAISIFLILLSSFGLILETEFIFYAILSMSIGIMIAGTTGNCLMANLLSKMWWNK